MPLRIAAHPASALWKVCKKSCCSETTIAPTALLRHRLLLRPPFRVVKQHVCNTVLHINRLKLH